MIQNNKQLPPVNKVDELLKCKSDPIYFIANYVYIYDSIDRGWIKFDLWSSQRNVVNLVHTNQLTIILKARQLGQTWTILGYGLWSMLFSPIAELLLFSRRDDEAVNLLDTRLKGMYDRLPKWMQCKNILQSNTHLFKLSNNSTARAFPTTSGDSYTATLVMVDEADLITNFNQLMRAVKPTIDNGGKFILLSRADKDTPQSEFKRIYRSSIKPNNNIEDEQQTNNSPWKGIFLPWSAHPGRDKLWYDRQVEDVMQRTGAMDDIYEQYPSTDDEALLPKTLNKRIPGEILLRNYKQIKPIKQNNPLYTIYQSPLPNRQYRVGVDPAEGNPTSDDSVAIVVDLYTGEEQAILSGKYQVQQFAEYAHQLSQLYNNAPLLIERNNHGHAIISELKNIPDYESTLLKGYDDKYGWLNNSFGKTKMYTDVVNLIASDNVIIHNETTFNQLSFIEGRTLRAPDGELDDFATAFSLAQASRQLNIDDNNFNILKGHKIYANKRGNR